MTTSINFFSNKAAFVNFAYLRLIGYPGPSCSKLRTLLVNVSSLNFKKLVSQICQYFLLKKCEKLLHCKASLSFFGQKISVYYVIKS